MSNDNKQHGYSFSRWFWTCVKICVLIVVVPLVIGSLAFLASIALPILLIAVPIMVAAFLWVIMT